MRRSLGSILALLVLTIPAANARADGEGVDGFPNWEERVHHALANRARVDPSTDLVGCGAKCLDAACYGPQPPLRYDPDLNHAARFHADEMTLQGYFDHPSMCTLVDDIAALYPGMCDGAAECACVGGVATCMPTCTDTGDRVKRWNDSWTGEIIASGADPIDAFYLWLHEPTGDPTCDFTAENGHRWLLLSASGSVGFGVHGFHVGDFGAGGDGSPIASGIHWPRAASTIEFWANWYDAAAPLASEINFKGECQPLALSRGTVENGAYTTTIKGLGGGCHRYFFRFVDADRVEHTFPSTGSFGIGPDDTCPIWSDERPADAAQCSSACTPSCEGKQCGDDGCGGSCGACPGNFECDEFGQCFDPFPSDTFPTTDSMCRDVCDPNRCDYSVCGNYCECAAGALCVAGMCQTETTGDASASATASATDSAGGMTDESGCACAGSPGGAASLLALPVIALLRRRRR